MKKSILFLPRWYPNKMDIQLGTFIQQQAQLIASDFDVSVIYVQADPNARQLYTVEESNNNNVTEVLVYFKSGNGIFSKIINAKRYKKAQQIGFEKLNKKIDLCHVHVPYRSAFLALQLLSKKNIPFVITEHWSGHLTGEYQQKNTADKTIYKKVLRKAEKITCVSKILQKHFTQNTGFTPEVIPNAIKSVTPTTSSTRTEKINILSVSDLNDSVKNITGLLEAFKISHQQNQALHLTIVGGGPDEDLIKKKIESLHLQNFVTLKGRLNHEQVLASYAQCDFYCCNSNFETFGMAIAEALLAGKPVISTKCGGPEEFLNTENSLTCETKNNAELITALLQMATSYKTFNSSKISSEIENKFGPSTIKKLWLEFYNGSF